MSMPPKFLQSDKAKHKDPWNLAPILCFLFLVVCLFLGYEGHIKVNSDTLFLTSLYQDLVIEGNSWNSWSFPAAPYYFPDMLVYWLIRLFTDDLFIAFVISQTLPYCGLILSSLYIYKGLYGKLTNQMALFTITLATLMNYIVTLISTDLHQPNHMGFRVLYRLTSHTGATVLAFICIGLVIRILKHESKIQMGLLFVFCGLTALSDKLFFCWFVVPALLALISFSLIGLIKKRISLILCSLISISSALGYWGVQHTNPYITRNYSNYFPAKTWEKVIILLGNLNSEIKELEGVTLYFYIFFIAMIVTIVISFFRFVCQISGNDATVHSSVLSQFFFLFYLFAILVNVSTVFYLELFLDLMHYFNLIIIASLFSLPILMSNEEGLIYFKKDNKTRNILLTSFVLITGFLGILSLWPMKNISFEYYPKIAKCLDDNKKQYHLTNGLADYWEPRIVSVFSKKGIWVNKINPDGDLHHWMNNMEWYSNIFNYNFFITKGLNLPAIIMKYGRPSSEFICDDKKIIVYNNENNIFKNLTAHHLLTKKLTLQASQLPASIGEVAGNNRVANEEDGPGHLIYGPYIGLHKGNYKFEVIYSSTANVNPVATWDIGVFLNSQKTILDSGIIMKKNAKQESIAKTITIDRFLESIEFRIHYKGNGQLTIHSLSIGRV